MLAVDGSEPLAGPELHPPRLLLFVAHAAGEQATGVGRNFRLPSSLALLPIRGPVPFPLNNRFRGNPGDPYSDLTLLASISRAIVVAGRPHGFGVLPAFWPRMPMTTSCSSSTVVLACAAIPG